MTNISPNILSAMVSFARLILLESKPEISLPPAIASQKKESTCPDSRLLITFSIRRKVGSQTVKPASDAVYIKIAREDIDKIRIVGKDHLLRSMLGLLGCPLNLVLVAGAIVIAYLNFKEINIAKLMKANAEAI